ncbi:lytic transglycosylase domain-containing protein [Microvirga massiliensis]|uniref:lytic transglycosylase domain-containing protein n=1 Tax=Microvirga massiliensis TaxID=1033741 RepID=UPI001FCDB8E5|nr:transglycosylase SLT domain-containing protein [Microvirga massiliensis]
MHTLLVRYLTCHTCAVAVWFFLASGAAADPGRDFPALPLPPTVETLVGIPQPHSAGRATHLELVRRAAEGRGLPPEVADAVAHVESAYDPNAVGAVGEIGLMQVRPETAALLGYTGPVAGLHEPTTNVRYGVRYLADAWKLANGNLCRTLMKYRAGHGEERMSERSVEYCRRVRAHLAAIGSSLANAPLPAADYFPSSPQQPVASARSQQARLRLTLGASSVRRAKSRQLWAAHEARLQAITRKLQPAQLRIASGI